VSDLLSVLSLWLSPPLSSFLIGFDEPLDGTIIGFLHIVGKDAGRKLSHPQMVVKTFAAGSLFAARFIAAVASCQIFLNAAFFHIFSPCSKKHL